MIVIEITAAVDAIGTLQTFYFSTERFVSGPSDVPAHTAFDTRVESPGFIGIHAFSDGRTGGGTKLETGELVLGNSDGQLDEWINYSFSGRPVVIRSGSGGAYPSSFTTVLSCTVDTIEVNFKKVVVRLKDKQYLFSLQALSNRYDGSNILPSGLEGTADDLKGKVKPKVYGKVYYVAPYCVNTSMLVYQPSDGELNDISAVYDRGAALTKGADYSNSAALLAATIAPGKYATCLREGYFRLGGASNGQITCDAEQGTSTALRTAAQILKQLAISAGVDPVDINAADVIAMDAANSASVGIYLSGNETFAQAMDQIAASIGGYYGFDPSGKFRMGVLAAPTGTPVVNLQGFQVGKTIERRAPKDNGEPVWSVTVNHSKVYTVQASDIAGSVTDERKAFVGLEFRSENAADANVQIQNLLAGQIEQQTLLVGSTEAGLEAARLLSLYKVRRGFFDVPVALETVTNNGLELMDVVSLQLSRFGLSAFASLGSGPFNSTAFFSGGFNTSGSVVETGKSFLLLGLRIELGKNRAILTLWG